MVKNILFKIGMISMRSWFSFLLMFLTHFLIAQPEGRPTPPGFPDYWIEMDEVAFTGHYCANSYQFNASTKTNMFMLDSLGYVAWYRKDQQETSSDFKYHPVTNTFTSNTYRDEIAGVFYTYDSQLNIIDTLIAANGERGDRHETLLLANGNKVIGTLYDTIMDLSAYTFNNITGIAECSVRGFGIQEFDSDNNLVWSWHSTDFIHPSAFSDGLNYNPGDFDYAHGNSIALANDGNLILSLRNTSAVYKIDRINRTGAILWQLGGEESSFSLSNFEDRFTAQHFAHQLPNGNIGLYDNGNLGWPNRFSRAAEYTLNHGDSTTNLAWSYDAGQTVFATAMGNAQWINDSLILIGWGFVYRPNPTFSLVNRSGDVLTSLYFEDTYMSYRIQATDLLFTLPRPHLSYQETEAGLQISAPLGYDEYIWSTGDTTSAIVVQENDIYQVWVPHGIGYVGSYPLEVSEIVGIETFTPKVFQFFPNPASEQLNVVIDFASSTSFSIEIRNMLGSGQQVYFQEEHAPHFSSVINTSTFSPGIYLLTIRTPQGVSTKRLVIN